MGRPMLSLDWCVGLGLLSMVGHHRCVERGLRWVVSELVSVVDARVPLLWNPTHWVHPLWYGVEVRLMEWEVAAP